MSYLLRTAACGYDCRVSKNKNKTNQRKKGIRSRSRWKENPFFSFFFVLVCVSQSAKSWANSGRHFSRHRVGRLLSTTPESNKNQMEIKKKESHLFSSFCFTTALLTAIPSNGETCSDAERRRCRIGRLVETWKRNWFAFFFSSSFFWRFETKRCRARVHRLVHAPRKRHRAPTRWRKSKKNNKTSSSVKTGKKKGKKRRPALITKSARFCGDRWQRPRPQSSAIDTQPKRIEKKGKKKHNEPVMNLNKQPGRVAQPLNLRSNPMVGEETR